MTTETIIKKIDEAAVGIKAAQEIASRNNAEIAENQAQIKAISSDVSGVLAEVQQIKQNILGLEKYSQEIEKSLERMPDNSAGEITKEDLKAKNEFLRYLRKGEKLSPEVVDSICLDIAKKSYMGVSDSEIQYHKKSLVEGVDSSIGYFVRPQISATIIKRQFETEPMRAIATVVSTSSNALEMIIDDNEASDGGWVGEIESRPETGTPKVGTLTIFAHELYAKPKMSQNLLDDAGFDAESWIMNKITDKLTRTENRAFVVGDGAKKPRGFASYPSWTTPSSKGVDGTYERGKLDHIKSLTNGDFDGDSVKVLQNSLIEDYQPGAVWLMQRKTFDYVITKKDGQGRYLLDVNSFKVGDDKILLGNRVIFAADMPAIATDALAIAYGDFKTGYTIVDRIGFRVVRDIYTAVPNILFYTTKRTGGDVTNYQCLKLLKLSA